MDLTISIGRKKNFTRARASARTEVAKIALIICSFSFGGPAITFALDSVLQQAAAHISDGKLEICLPAIEKLGHSKDASAVAPLASAFATEQRPLVRRYLVDALGLLSNPDARPTLILALNDADAQVRQSAVVALETLGGKESEQALAEHAQNETDFAVKAHLIPALGRAHDPKALDQLKELQNDDNDQISGMADQEFKKHINHEGN
jgi:hypothetical protein